VAVTGSDESISNLEPSGVGAADRVLDSFPVEGGPVVVAETNADDEVVQVGEPVVVQADAESERVVSQRERQDESPDGVTRLDDVPRKPVSWRRRNGGQTSLPPGGGGVLWRRTDGRHSTCTRVLPEVLGVLSL